MIYRRIGIVVAAGIVALLGTLKTPAAESEGINLARELNRAFIEVADKISGSVVVIRVAHKNPAAGSLFEENSEQWEWLPREFRRQLEEHFKKQREQPEEDDGERRFDGQGSGIVIRKEGFILTNRHVVEGADKIQVRFKDDSHWYEAQVRGVDAQSDVAVIKIDPKGREMYVAKLGDSEKVKVGEFAIAIGAPFSLDYSVTFGHISAKGRSQIIADRRMDQDFLQTDASINPGNSGGPLVNIDGEVIGINTLIRGLQTGIGFAIPINLAREISDMLISEGKYVRPWLGVGIRAIRDYPEFRETDPKANDGVVVTELQPGGPAAKSELKPGDVITGVDGKPVATAQQLRNEIRAKKVGQDVKLDVYRGGKNIKVAVKTEAWPEETVEVASRTPSGSEKEQSKSFGLTVKALTKELADQFDVERTDGVIVTEVEQGTAAFRKGIRPGDVITEVDRKPVASVKEFRDAIKSADAKKGVVINFISRGTSKFEVLKESGD